EMERPDARPRSLEIHATDGSRIYSITCSAVRGFESAVEGLVLVVSDITEARAVQVQLAQSEKLSALGEMISGVAHELNNPLASVLGNAEFVQEMQVDEGIRKKLAIIATESGRCRTIVQKLLQFVRPHAPEKSLVDLNATIDSVLQLLSHQLEGAGVSVVLDLKPDIALVLGDGHLLGQVLLNIMNNAYQAMKENGGPGRLTVRSDDDGSRVSVEISDTGPGIAPENLERIFNPFFTTKEVGLGTGLGLSLAYRTMQEHAGEITAKSRLGVGSTFTVTLPSVPRVVAEAGLAAGDLPASTAQHPSRAARDERAGARILVVDDEETLAEVMAEVLQTRGHVVDVAGDGRTASGWVSSRRYDLIITDLRMPGMNGRDFYRQVTAAHPDLSRRIIFSTGDTASPETQAFFEEVGNPVLEKPFRLAELLRLVDETLADGPVSD
ncbi:MAG TPA: ATP-binding protein, partial [Candidatus Polarisedimenticolia bacterium]|nr:ATP-binding protein [Candidatus Polarisedimenticolia bacterium]